MKKVLLFVIAAFCLASAFSQKKPVFSTEDYVRALKHATDVMVNDVTSPVAAARYYGYINIAANETLTLFDKQNTIASIDLSDFYAGMIGISA